jgi:hypothetical protein
MAVSSDVGILGIDRDLMLEGAGGSRLAPEPEKPGVVSRISSRVHPASARTKKPIAGRVPDRRTVREFQFRE